MTKQIEIAQLPLNSREMWLVASALRYSMASAMSDVQDQITSRNDFIEVVNELGPEGYNAIQTRIVLLARAAFSDVAVIVDSDPTGELCTHCGCSDPICCWCSREKS